jgi:hypothetical protein
MTENGLSLRPLGATERIVAGLFAGGFAAGSIFVALNDPATTSIFPPCPLLKLTGYACPGCGLTRGFHALFHGDVLGALDFNAMIPFYILLLGFLFVSLSLTAIRGRGLSGDGIPVWGLYGLIALMAAFAILRNLPYAPFSIMFP